MKKFAAFFLCAGMMFSLAACSDNTTQTETAPPPSTASITSSTDESVVDESIADESIADEASQTEDTAEDKKILIAYFSVPETDGVDTVAGASRVVVEGEVLGNNQYVAQLIQQEVGGDLFRIETVQEYPGSHDPLLDFAYNEKAENARPELSSQI